MKSSFHGHQTSEHYEKDIKDITIGQWAYLALFLPIFAAVAASIVMVKPGFIVGGFGLLFLWFAGLLPVVFQKKLFQSIPCVVFLVVGIVAILVGAVMLSGILSISGLWYLYVGLWMVFGFIMIIFSNNKVRMGKRCSKCVIATCVEGERKELTYYLDGLDFIVEASQYFGPKNKGFVNGSRVEIWVNPDKPEQLIPKKKMDSMFLWFGICCIFVALFGVGIITLVETLVP